LGHAPNHGRVDPVLLNDWHVVADLSSLRPAEPFATRLLGIELLIYGSVAGDLRIERRDTRAAVPFKRQYGFLWACIGEPARDIIDIPEAHEEDRFIVTGGSLAVNVSGLRAVENFLDMGHFPFIHTGWLGEEPHTEVPPYRVEITDNDEVLATECKFYQPVASPTATGGIMANYEYKVSRPYTVALYKTNPVQPERMDYIALFVQPVDEEHCIAHPLLCYLKHNTNEAELRWFMQLIFAQDKPILENQVPKRLPLDPRAETPIRADASSVYYRRWLRGHDITYGAIAAIN
jgi:phenylpropionate dioxygenase-like ring-hydroxylating dioxygenase large terminal subunit